MMSSSSTNDSISTILAKPNKTTNDLHQIIDQWHRDLLQNEDRLLQHAHQLSEKQQTLNRTTETCIQAQDLLSNLEKNLQHFQLSIQTLTEYNDELETNIEELNHETKSLLPNIPSNLKTDQDRSITYDLMESVDTHLNELNQTMNHLNQTLHINTDQSVVETVNELETCFQDIQKLQETIKQIKL